MPKVFIVRRVREAHLLDEGDPYLGDENPLHVKTDDSHKIISQNLPVKHVSKYPYNPPRNRICYNNRYETVLCIGDLCDGTKAK